MILGSYCRQCSINVTGEKLAIINAAAGDRTRVNTLPHRYKSWLVPQGSTSVSYTYHYYIFPLLFMIRPRIFTSVVNEISLYSDVVRVSAGHLHQMLQMKKKSNHRCRGWGSNPGPPPPLRHRPTLYRVAIKAGLYCLSQYTYRYYMLTNSNLVTTKMILTVH